MSISRILFWFRHLYTNTYRLRFWLLWVFVNTSTLGFGFGFGCWWYIRFSGDPNPGIDFYSFPLGPYELLLVSLGLCLIQVPFLHQFRWRRNSMGSILATWMFSNFSVLALIGTFRYLFYFLLLFVALMLPESTTVYTDPMASVKNDYLTGALVGAVAGFMSGGIVGVAQFAIMPTCKRWIPISAISWLIASALAWMGRQHSLWSFYYGSVSMQDWADIRKRELMDSYGTAGLPVRTGFFLELPYQLAIYGAVLGLVSSAILGVAMLALFPRRSRSAD
jgi:hypothetical protein